MKNQMLKEIEFSTETTDWEATYRVSAGNAKKLQDLLNANENGEDYNGESPYAISQVYNENGKWYAEFSVTADWFEMEPRDWKVFKTEESAKGDHFYHFYITNDLRTIGFWD